MGRKDKKSAKVDRREVWGGRDGEMMQVDFE